jgi:hypothetical protein
MVLNEAKVPDSHGMGHCTKVLEHMHKTLESCDKAFACSYYFDLTDEQKLSMQLGALLHDADDRKYFSDDSQNAKQIINAALTEIDSQKVLDDHT